MSARLLHVVVDFVLYQHSILKLTTKIEAYTDR